MDKSIINTCRACLRQNLPLKNLLTEYTEGKTGIKLSHIFENCTSIVLPQDTNAVPQMICIMCELSLKTCYYFQLQCTQVNDEYATLYNKPEESEMSKEEERLVQYEYIEETPVKIEEPIIINDNEMINNDVGQTSLEYFDDAIPESNFKTEDPMPVEVLKHDTFVCDKCQKTFMNRRYLEIHLKTHQNQQYTCEICDKKCSSKSVLRIHLKKHTMPESSHDPSTVSNHLILIFVFICFKCVSYFHLSLII